MNWQSVYLLVDICLVLLAISFDGVAPDVAMFVALLVLWAPGVVDSKTALAGFANPGLMTVVALFVVIGGVQKMPILSKAASLAFGVPTRGRVALLKQILIVATFSVFINNTPLVAFFIPLILDWCRTYRQNPSLYLMPLSYASIMGDLSVIGTSTSLVVQGLVTARGLPPIRFFDLALVGAPALVLGTLYLTTYGYSVLSKINPTRGGGGGDGDAHPDRRGGDASATDYVSELVLDKGSPLVGQPVVLKVAHVFAGGATALRILRSAGPAGVAAPLTTVPPDTVALPPRVISPVTEGETFQEGDRILVRAGQEALLRSYSQQRQYRFRFTAGEAHPGTRDARRLRALKSTLAALVEYAATRLVRRGRGRDRGTTPSPSTTSAHPQPSPDVRRESAPPPSPPVINNGFEVILSTTSPVLGALVSSGALEEAYAGVTVLGIRLGMSNPHVGSFGLNRAGGGGEGGGGDGAPAPEVDSTAVSASRDGGEAEDKAQAQARESGTFLSSPTSKRPVAVVVVHSPAFDMGSIAYAAGDSVLITASKDFSLDYAPGRCRDFFVVAKVAGASDIEPTGATQAGSLVILVGMFVLGSLGSVGGVRFEMEKAAMLGAGLNLVLGFVTPKEAYKLIQWDLVVLIGSSFGLGAAMENTGLAQDIAAGIVGVVGGAGPHAALFALYGVTLLLTELISNNAAATLTIPVAINMAQQLGVNYEPFVLAICVACTAAFALPLGYQTHLMVMAPGRYTQRDFLRVGLGMDLIYWLVIAGLAPVVWKF